MNSREGHKAASFVGVLRRDNEGKAVRLTVPGHDGRWYVVGIERKSASATCMRMDYGNEGVHCAGNSNGTVCYHVLAAMEKIAQESGYKVAWCPNDKVAHKLAHTGGKVLCVKSAQGQGRAWGVAKSTQPTVKCPRCGKAGGLHEACEAAYDREERASLAYPSQM